MPEGTRFWGVVEKKGGGGGGGGGGVKTGDAAKTAEGDAQASGSGSRKRRGGASTSTSNAEADGNHGSGKRRRTDATNNNEDDNATDDNAADDKDDDDKDDEDPKLDYLRILSGRRAVVEGLSKVKFITKGSYTTKHASKPRTGATSSTSIELYFDDSTILDMHMGVGDSPESGNVILVPDDEDFLRKLESEYGK